MTWRLELEVDLDVLRLELTFRCTGSFPIPVASQLLQWCGCCFVILIQEKMGKYVGEEDACVGRIGRAKRILGEDEFHESDLLGAGVYGLEQTRLDGIADRNRSIRGIAVLACAVCQGGWIVD